MTKDEAWKWFDAPVKTQWGSEMVVADLAIDKDHTASIYCERDQTTKVEAMFNPPAAPVQDSTCNNSLREQGKAYPRTCRKCGLGPCIALANAALDKKAENARALGLDYEPVGWWDSKIGFFEEKHFDQLQPLYTTPPAAPVQPVQEPEIVQRVKRYAGQTMRTARNPNITARECIELANWIAGGQPAAQPAPVQEPVCWKHGDEPKSGCAWCDKQPPAAQRKPLTDEQIGNDPIFRAGVRFAEAAHGITKGQP